ncbi:quinate permease [Gaeumannomyces tritici R3-111a-1]|uniref:Quinate permease n=1 Tax=Gaeumannomyces tritici (strain R3-111a-1) TaxID=644352 RepID=J3P6C9_GAET3|nr:quinate permease [Gaeumannomyces tritici R3-111a-1]EJT72203.1 quinate permease [Gaeumannomyces tritici R3-111a-1]
MGGGTSLWASPDWKNDPKQIFNSRLWFLVVAVSFAGFSYGFDHGNVGGVLRQGEIASMMSAGAAVGALCAGPFSEYLGRKGSMITYGSVFLVGAVMQLMADLSVFQAGRFIGGLGIGGTSVLSPQYLAESSPKTIRGSLTTLYNLAIILALSLAFWVNYGVSRWNYAGVKTDDRQWRTSMAIQIIPAGAMALLIAIAIDSPRGLIARNKCEKGLEALCKLRGLPADHPYADVVNELNKNRTYLLAARDIIKIPSYRRRFALATTLFIFHKLTGTDAINYFAPQIFPLLGVSSGSMSLMTTGIYGVVKFFASLLYATAMLYIGLYVRFGPKEAPAGGGVPAGGIVGVIWIYVYAFGWSFGHSVAPYVLAVEVFPSGIRSFSISFCLMLNWLFGFAVSLATPHMLRVMGYGTFLFFAGVTYVGVVYVYFCMPELKGRSIESMDDLFEHRLWEMFRHAYPTEDEKARKDVQRQMLDETKGAEGVVHAERSSATEDSDGVDKAASKA